MSKARHSKKDAPETDNFICFEGGGKDAPWINAFKTTFTESSGEFDAIIIDSFCGSDIPFGPNQARKFAQKILGWCHEIDGK
jgi:hypothetical protein